MSGHFEQRRPIAPALEGLGLLILAASFTSACFRPRASFTPPPPRIESIEGYASLLLRQEGSTAKSRFSFVFSFPERGRVEVAKPLGGTAAILFLGKDEAFFVLPAKKAYWKSTQEDAVAKFLGFALRLDEITALLSGRLAGWKDWALQKDDRGRVVRGERGSLKFEVNRFFGDTPLPWQIVFSGDGSRGSLKILHISFNKPLKKDAYRLFFLEDKSYRFASWDEIEKWVRDES